MKRIIYHVDVNSAFLSWEAVYRLYHLGGSLDIREIPSAIAGDQEKRRGIILAKSIPAQCRGVRTGEPIVSAKRKCPELFLAPPNYRLYRRSSKAMMEILSRYTDKVEQYSIDEAFMDMTGCAGDAERTAVQLKETIFRELGFTVNVGVAENKLLAKMASGFVKPNRVHTLWKEEIREKMWPLPVRNLFYIGPAAEKKLLRLGIQNIGELAGTQERILRANFQSYGTLILNYANGIDDSQVAEMPPPNKGYGNSLTTPWDIRDPELARKFLLSLAETVAFRLRADGVRSRIVAVTIRDSNFRTSSRQTILSAPTDLTWEIYQAACRCFDYLWNGLPVRNLGIHTSRISREDSRQIGLFDKVDYEKTRKAEEAVDSLRRRYGIDCMKRACFLEPVLEGSGQYIDHMGGGITREKWTADYSEEEIR